MFGRKRKNPIARNRREGERPRGRDWIATAIAVAGLALGVTNFCIARQTRLDLQQQTLVEILSQVAKALDDLEDPMSAPGRSRDVTMTAVGKQLDRALAMDPSSADVRRLKAEQLWIAGRSEEAI